MRHGKRINHLGRTAPHRKAMLANMASSLISQKRISTTVPKAKALRKYVEPLITKSKTDSTHSRRTVFSYLQNKDSLNILFDEVADKVAARPGGYTRIIKTGNRLGDNAEMCIIELVDYNELLLAEKEPKTKTRRSRRGGKKAKASGETKAVETEAGSKQEESVKTKETKEEEENKAAEEEATAVDQPEATNEDLKTEELADKEATAKDKEEDKEDKKKKESGDDAANEGTEGDKK